jgi:hypothetical protein
MYSTKESMTSSWFAAYPEKRLHRRSLLFSEFEEHPKANARPRPPTIPVAVTALRRIVIALTLLVIAILGFLNRATSTVSGKDMSDQLA